MEIATAVSALSALAQEHRLAVFRLLVGAGAEGMAAGDIARELGILPNTLSTHLAVLSRAGLAGSRRQGRSIRYHADYDGMNTLLAFLIEDCCGGRPELCGLLGDPVACR